ncbi:MAG: multidrug transporter substrate-binding protein [Verrucomicrobiales bacterium]|nr:multidrug transporter substrate-binding protein [Verrucomicrobiales bacterium]
MRIGTTFRTSLRALRRNKMRSLLTALGIIIGVGAVIAMVSIGNGAKAQVESQIAGLGENVMLVMSGNVNSRGMSSGFGGAGTLTVGDMEAIVQEVSGVQAVSPEVRRSMRVAAGNQNWFTQITGVSPEYFDLRQWPFTDGVSFTDRDVRGATKTAVIGATVAREVFGDSDPVGQTLRVRDVPFLITGVLSRKGSSLMGSDQDDAVFIPYTSAMKRIMGTDSLRMIHVQGRKSSPMADVQAQVTSLLMQRHRIGGGKDPDFMVRSQEEIAQMATETSKVMTALLAAIASVSLLVGGIGIMNIMLVSVTERTREIGIRMAVGAHGKDILLQFLVESIVLSSLGGIFGILLGVGSAKLVTYFTGWSTVTSPSAIVLSFTFSAAIGIFFGFYPARKAAALDPIDALRYE